MTAKKQPPQKPPASLEPAAAAASPVQAMDPAVAKELSDLRRKNEELMRLLEAQCADKASQPGTPQQKQLFTPPTALAKAPPTAPPATAATNAGAAADEALPDAATTSPAMVLDPHEAELAERFDLSDKDMLSKKTSFKE